MTVQLGKIAKVDLREIWPHEALDFTKWLSKETNLNQLGDAVDMTLELIETESPVGSFSVDIYATDTSSGSKIIIENQLEDTDHDHLGKIITYAAGKDAQAVVWVVKHARDEHRQAIEWLNAHTDDGAAFFLVEVEVWRIGDSKPAAVFNVVERPNEWTRTEKAKEGITETERMRLDYWSLFREVAQSDKAFSAHMRPRKAKPNHASDISLGTTSYHLCAHFLWRDDQVGIEICVPDDKELAADITEHQHEFEEILGVKGIPYGEGKKSAGIRFYRSDCGLKDTSNWKTCIAWQLDAAVKMRKKIIELGF